LLINAVAAQLNRVPEASMSTAAHPVGSMEDYLNPNVVKVVLNARSLALYFSRAPIAWWRDGHVGHGFRSLPSPVPLRHIGLYAYRAGFLRLFRRPSRPWSPWSNCARSGMGTRSPYTPRRVHRGRGWIPPRISNGCASCSPCQGPEGACVLSSIA
jgi:hypothetical protein